MKSLRISFVCLILISVVHCFEASGQTVTVGKPYPVINTGHRYYYSNGTDIVIVKIIPTSTVLTMKVGASSVILQTMKANDLAPEKRREYNDFPKDCQLEFVTQLKGHFYFFYSSWTKDQKDLFYREIDVASGEFKSKGIKLMSITGKNKGTMTSNFFYSVDTPSDEFDYFLSYDSTSMLIQHRLKSEKTSNDLNYDVVSMHVFDKDLKEVWGNDVQMPYTEKKMDNLDYSVDVKGNAYIVARVFNDNTTDLKKSDEDYANYHLEILKVASTGAITSTKVEVGKTFVKRIWLYESPQGHMICAGYYNLGKKKKNVDGVIFFKLGQDGTLSDMNTHEIPLSVLNQYTKAGTASRNARKDADDEAEFKNLRLNEVVVQRDGSIVITGEEVIPTSSTNNVGDYNDLLVVKISASGELGWMRRIPKRMDGMPYYISYYYHNGIQNHYYLFLDNEVNLKSALTDEPVSRGGYGRFLLAYKINDETGEVTKSSVLDIRNVGGIEVFQFAPKRMVSISPNSFVFEIYKKSKEDALVKVVLDNGK